MGFPGSILISSTLSHKKSTEQDHVFKWSDNLWPEEERFPDLLSLLLEHTLQLPLFWNLLVHPHYQKFLQGLEIIKLHMCMEVIQRYSHKQVFHQRLLKEQHSISGSLLHISTNQCSQPSAVGVDARPLFTR